MKNKLVKNILIFTFYATSALLFLSVIHDIREKNQQSTILSNYYYTKQIYSTLTSLAIEKTENYLNRLTDNIFNIKLIDFSESNLLISNNIYKNFYYNNVFSETIEQIQKLRKRPLEDNPYHWYKTYQEYIVNLSENMTVKSPINIELINNLWFLGILIDGERGFIASNYIYHEESNKFAKELIVFDNKINKLWEKILIDKNNNIILNDLKDFEKLYFTKFQLLKSHPFHDLEKSLLTDFEGFINISQEIVYQIIKMVNKLFDQQIYDAKNDVIKLNKQIVLKISVIFSLLIISLLLNYEENVTNGENEKNKKIAPVVVTDNNLVENIGIDIIKTPNEVVETLSNSLEEEQYNIQNGKNIIKTTNFSHNIDLKILDIKTDPSLRNNPKVDDLINIILNKEASI